MLSYHRFVQWNSDLEEVEAKEEPESVPRGILAQECRLGTPYPWIVKSTSKAWELGEDGPLQVPFKGVGTNKLSSHWQS